MKHQPYPKYKDSGVEWIGAIPEGWIAMPLGRLFERCDRAVPDDVGTVTAFRDGQVTLRSNRREDGFTNALLEIGYQGVHEGDLVIHAMDGFAGAIGVSDSTGKCSPVYSICTPRRHSTTAPVYFAYQLRSMALSGYITALAKGIRERSTDFRWADAKAVTVVEPDFRVQISIAAFLDRETAKIDTLVRDYEDLVALLTEKRQALISHAVTRGLSELVDANDPEFGEWCKPVRFRDSGVEWLGEIPEGWEVTKIGYVADFASGGTPSKDRDDYWNGDIPWVSPKDMKRVSIDSAEDHVSPLAISESGLKMIEPGSLLIVVRGMILVHSFPVAIATVPVTINQDMKAVRVARNLIPEYVCSYLIGIATQVLSFYVDQAAHGTLAIRMEGFRALPILIPTQQEQSAIAAFLTRETTKIDTLVRETQDAIELLKEHRSALITAAVTGKINVEGS